VGSNPLESESKTPVLQQSYFSNLMYGKVMTGV
jgi:hypothetical protein